MIELYNKEEKIDRLFKNLNEVWVYVLRHQGQSVNHAFKYEGWKCFKDGEEVTASFIYDKN